MKNALEFDEAGTFPGAGLFLVPWKCDAANEQKIKEECKATIRCYPLDANKAGMSEGKNVSTVEKMLLIWLFLDKHFKLYLIIINNSGA